ncbi:hypothetical protein [Pseudomonas sp. R11-23-07]|uniref:hypothetical protein n=1 Tax=Pseudomonas sp. R11-23-07 TaxID=658632 RepID=UPI000F56D4FB|nr:hypothetical protein [Pseudomonas sp. R11-23-07]
MWEDEGWSASKIDNTRNQIHELNKSLFERMGLNMDPNEYLNASLIDVLAEFRRDISIVEYVKVEGEEFLKLPEYGVYFQAGSDGVIVAYRVYYQASDEYFPADAETKTACADIETIEESIAKYGAPLRNVPSVRIPGRAPTSPGCEFLVRGNAVTVHYDFDSKLVDYVHVRRKFELVGNV